jgi:chaperonin GroEL (HSP60 family)
VSVHCVSSPLLRVRVPHVGRAFQVTVARNSRPSCDGRGSHFHTRVSRCSTLHTAVVGSARTDHMFDIDAVCHKLERCVACVSSPLLRVRVPHVGRASQVTVARNSTPSCDGRGSHFHTRVSRCSTLRTAVVGSARTDHMFDIDAVCHKLERCVACVSSTLLRVRVPRVGRASHVTVARNSTPSCDGRGSHFHTRVSRCSTLHTAVVGFA